MDSAQENTAWWQTGLHIVAALALYIPLIYVAGFLVYIYDFFVQGYIGRSGDGIGFFMRGIQYFLAAIASLVLPALLLKRANGQIVGAVWTTIYGLLFVAAVILPPLSGAPRDFWEWLEIIATAIGTVVAGGGFTIGAFREGL